MIEFLEFALFLPNMFLCVNVLLFVLLTVKTKKKTHTILMVYLLAILGVQLYSAWLAFKGSYNLHISHFYFIIQFLVLGYFYYIICTQRLQKNLIKYSMTVCLLILGIQYGIAPETYFKFNNLEIFLTSYLLIVYALFHFYNLLSAKKSFLFFNIGLFFYLFGSTVLFLVGNLSAVIDIKSINFDINNILYFIFQLFVFMEWIQLYFKKENSNPKKLNHGV
tara:strand:- start:55255 stop:55917 length:663 start_codon:yes stop_codon:yes gene_type:complete